MINKYEAKMSLKVFFNWLLDNPFYVFKDFYCKMSIIFNSVALFTYLIVNVSLRYLL